MDDRSDRYIVYRDRQYAKGYRACGGYGTAEVWLMELAWLEAEAAAVLLVALPRIGLIFDRLPKEHSYRGNRPKYSWEVGRNWRIGDISGVRSGCKYRSN